MCNRYTYKVSVIVLTYQHEKTILNCLESIIHNNLYYNFLEVIITDDGSTDKTPKIIESFISKNDLKIKFIKNQHEGIKSISKNFNIMINLSKGEYISFLSGDDCFNVSRFQKQIDEFQTNNLIKIIYSNGLNINNGLVISEVVKKDLKEILLSKDNKKLNYYLKNNIPELYIQSILARSDFLKEFIPFDEDMIADDWVFNIRSSNEILRNNYLFSFLDEKVFFRKIHNQSTSINLNHHIPRNLLVIEKYCDTDSKFKLKANLYFSMLLLSLKFDLKYFPILVLKYLYNLFKKFQN